MYSCPAPHGDGYVITNLMRDADAAERECEPLQGRRSSLDRPARRTPPSTSTSADTFSDDWISASPRPAAARVQEPGRSKPRAAPLETPREAVREVSLITEPARGDSGRRIAKQTQSERDIDSRKIIESELNKEHAAVAELRKRIESIAKDSPERQRVQESLVRHTADVDSLKSELARMR